MPLDFIPTVDELSADEATANKLMEEYNLDFASCVGALIYLALTRTDIIFAVNKLAKFTRRPGENHIKALLHLLGYLRDHTHLGVRFYSNLADAPVTKLLQENGHDFALIPFYGFSDSSWNDDVDNGRSTGSFLVLYMGGVVDHSSNLPDPVALSSAEAEYNQACLACMALSHLRMFLDELEMLPANTASPSISIFLDSSSAIAMGNSFRDTKHTRHILRRYHFVRTGVEAGRYALLWIATKAQLADIGTKQLSGPVSDYLIQFLMVALAQEG